MKPRGYVKRQTEEVQRYLGEIRSKSGDAAYAFRVEEAYKAFKPYIKEPLLDLGSRDGRMLKLLTFMGLKKVRGIEIVPKAVKLARSAGLDVEKGDVHDLTRYRRGMFNTVLALHLFEHCYEPPAVASEVMRVLKKGGVVCIESPMERKDQPGEWGHYINFQHPVDAAALFPKCPILYEERLKRAFRLILEKP